MLAIYFSCGGVTKRIAEYMGIECIELKAKEPYIDDDLLAANPKARVCVEQETDCRVEYELDKVNVHADKLVIGFPLWFLRCPRIITTFLSDIKPNVEVNVFCTSGGSPINVCEKELRNRFPEIKWGKFKQFSYTTRPEEIKGWVNGL